MVTCPVWPLLPCGQMRFHRAAGGGKGAFITGGTGTPRLCVTVGVSPALPRCRVACLSSTSAGCAPWDSQIRRVTTRVAPIRIGVHSVWQSPRPQRIGRVGARCPRWRKNVRMMIFRAEETGWLTAPIRNENPRYRRLTGTKAPAFGVDLQWITKYPYLKHFLKTIEIGRRINLLEVVPDVKAQLPVTPARPPVGAYAKCQAAR